MEVIGENTDSGIIYGFVVFSTNNGVRCYESFEKEADAVAEVGRLQAQGWNARVFDIDKYVAEIEDNTAN